VLHPGFWNREAGPDFLRAIIRFGDTKPVSGDVEIDLLPSGWRSHGHATNPAYRQVVLHVVWKAGAGPVPLPTVALENQLDAPLEELELWVGGAGDMPREWLAGQCSAPLRRLSPQQLAEIIQQAAVVRMETKARLLRARARVAGWHAALWEGLFRALGYKHNGWPMQRLAELLCLAEGAARPEPPHLREVWEARLLGLAGLLPLEPRSGTHARRLWDLWWRERAAFEDHLLPASLWRLNGVRPVNHPQRRLALAACWLSDPSWVQRLESWFRATPSGPEAEHSLTAILRPETPGFWRRHHTLTAREAFSPLPLLGAGRVNEIAVNVILPWFWARAVAGGDTAARQYVESLLLGWSPGEDNTVLKLARARLFDGETPVLRNSASLQQGLLQIVRDFCGYSNALCDQCPLPSLLQQL
jgi:hypothetical protein